MLNFEFVSTTKIIFGKDTHHDVGTVIKKYGYKKVLIHYGQQHIKKSGLYDQIVNSLNDADVEHVSLGGVKPNPVLSLANQGIDVCKKESVDFILAVGGGSAIDSAKAIAMGVPYEGDVWDFYSGKEPKEALPVGVVLTIAAAGSESSKNTVITNEDGMIKRGVGFDQLRPVFAIMNPELTMSLPAFHTACGIVDIMAHVMERYFSVEKNVDVTDRLCEGLLKSVLQNAPRVMEQPDDYHARAEIMWAGALAHNGLLGTGRTEEWSAHRIAHEISAYYDGIHGETLSILFPAWMKYTYERDIPLFAKFFTRVMNIDYDFDSPKKTVLTGIRELEQFFVSLGLKIRLKDLNVDPAKFKEMAKRANSRGNLGIFYELKDEDIVRIFEMAYNDH